MLIVEMEILQQCVVLILTEHYVLIRIMGIWCRNIIDAYINGQFITYTITCICFSFGNVGEDNLAGVVSDTFLKTTQIYNIDLED